MELPGQILRWELAIYITFLEHRLSPMADIQEISRIERLSKIRKEVIVDHRSGRRLHSSLPKLWFDPESSMSGRPVHVD
jgi:hypothetical protein